MNHRRQFAMLVAAGVSTLPATVLAQLSPSFATPTTTTTTPPVIVTPTTSTTTTTTTTSPVLVIPTTTTTTAPVLVTPTTTTGLDDLVQPTVPPDGDGSDVPLGEIDTSGAVPEGLDLTAFP